MFSITILIAVSVINAVIIILTIWSEIFEVNDSMKKW